MDISKVILSGEVVSDPQKITGNNGNEFGKLSLRVNDRYDSPDKVTFYNILVSSFKLKDIENITKGARIMISGKLRADMPKDNKNNLSVSLDTIDLIAPAKIKTNITTTNEELKFEDEIPF